MKTIVLDIFQSKAKLLLLFTSSLLLSACALPMRVDTDVQSFNTQPIPTRISYQWDLLPSQASDADWAALLKNKVEPILAQHHLFLFQPSKDESNPTQQSAPYALQLTLARTPSINPFAPQDNWPPYINGFAQWGIEGCPFGSVYTHSSRCYFPPDKWWLNTLNLLLRDNQTHAIVYETHAAINGPWRDTLFLLPVMLDAALKNYPQGDGKTKTISTTVKAFPAP